MGGKRILLHNVSLASSALAQEDPWTSAIAGCILLPQYICDDIFNECFTVVLHQIFEFICH